MLAPQFLPSLVERNLHIYRENLLVLYDKQVVIPGVSCRGVVFGTIYGGIIYPPAAAIYFPQPIVQVVVFGPVFAQSVFIGPSGSPYFCDTAFYGPNNQRIYNPCEPQYPAVKS